MASTQNSQGIQTLLEAEKEASKIVAKARQYRVQRLKEAKAEAQKEIDELKQQKEAEYAKAQSQTENTAAADLLANETDEKMVAIKALYQKNKDVVLQKLLATVTTVDAVVHRNINVGDIPSTSG